MTTQNQPIPPPASNAPQRSHNSRLAVLALVSSLLTGLIVYVTMQSYYQNILDQNDIVKSDDGYLVAPPPAPPTSVANLNRLADPVSVNTTVLAEPVVWESDGDVTYEVRKVTYGTFKIAQDWVPTTSASDPYYKKGAEVRLMALSVDLTSKKGTCYSPTISLLKNGRKIVPLNRMFILPPNSGCGLVKGVTVHDVEIYFAIGNDDVVRLDPSVVDPLYEIMYDIFLTPYEASFVKNVKLRPRI
jgi:hypothetical protein